MVRIVGMPDHPAINQQIHDLLNEANLLVLEMMLPGSKAASKAPQMVARLRDCANQARDAGQAKIAQHLSQVASMVETELSKSTL